MSKTKKLLIVLMLLLLVLLLPNIVKASETLTATSTINGVTVNWTYTLNDNNQIKDLKCTNVQVLTGSISIPSTIDDKTVVSIGSGAFENATGITKVTIPDSVKTIEYSAFEGCTSLNEVDLGSIESISFDVFTGCTSLESITIPKTLKNGPVSPVFKNCSNLTSITFEEGITIIPQNLCATTGITEVIVPDSVKTIENSSFENCTSLSEVDLGSIESISFDVFTGCTSLESITIPKTLKNGPVSPVFKNCSNLTSITFEEGITVIPQNLCATTGITEIVLPDSVKTIENSAFENCTSLSEVDLGSIESISFDVFTGCTSLESITIPKTLKNGPVSPVFKNCSNLTSITFEEGITVIPKYLCATTGIIEVVVPTSVKTIEYSAFENCTSLTKITILDNVENIGLMITQPTEDAVFTNHNNDLTIYCYEGSVAAQYAINTNIKYEYLTKPAGEQEATDDNKKTFNNHKYQIIDKLMTWQEAKEYCESLGGYLVTITSAEEQAFIASLIKEKGFTQNRFWMGATDKDKEGTWKWITGEKFDYSNWGRTQPNNGESGGQHYGVFVAYDATYNGIKLLAEQWDDINEDSEEDIYFICEWGEVEKETTTNPPTTTDKDTTKDTTTAKDKLPNTGRVLLFWIIGIVATSGIVAHIRYKKLYM